jgi:ribosome biogenesis GTPase A
MPSFWRHVNTVLEEAEIIIEVLDARMIEETRNKEIERKIKQKILYVVTKCDLVDVRELKKRLQNLKPVVFISSKDRLGTTILKKKILEISRGKPVTVGVVGYPNVGKSSLINALASRKAARTSSESGFTKGMQKVKVDNKIMLLDTPGVFAAQEDKLQKIKIGAIDYAKVKDPEIAALKLIEEYGDSIKSSLHIKGEDAEEILEKIAFKHHKLEKGGKPNLESAARYLLKLWQTGKIYLK